MKLTAILDIALAVFLVLLIIAAIWFVIELARVVRRASKTLDEVNKSIEPLVSNVNVILENAQPVVAHCDPLVEHATLTVDALNLEIMRLDPVIEDLGDVTGSLTNAIDGISNAPSKLANSIHDKLDGISLPGKEKVANVIANAKSKVAARGAAADTEVKSYTTVGAKAASAPAKADAQDPIEKRAAHAKDEVVIVDEAPVVDEAVFAEAVFGAFLPIKKAASEKDTAFLIRMAVPFNQFALYVRLLVYYSRVFFVCKRFFWFGENIGKQR